MNIKEIDNPKQIKQLSINELEHLSQDIRTFIMENVSKTGGHFSSNLGITDLTVALHYVFDSPKDKFIFDVGHQSYVHKILTGRAKDFSTLRQYNGLSGFQRRNESEHDPWEAGHSSTSISGATGIAIARDLNKEDFQVIAIIGDAAILSGESLEALNYLGSSNTKVIVILNDNDMSISKNVGGLSKALSDIRVSKQYNEAKDNYTQFMMKTKAGKEIYKATKKVKDKIKHRVMIDSLFQQFGIDYLGPVDGHDMGELINALTTAKKLDHSVILHVKTIKGKGYPRAEQDKIGLYHGVPPFDLKKGILNKTNTHSQKWSEAIANHIEYMMGKHDDICVITPAMISGSQLNHIFKSYPNRSFDVGIAEEHAMTFLAGLSVGGKFPFLSIYSSFAQRAYDQLNHDVARMDLPCLIGIDRCDLVGSDGSTHHGVFDISFMRGIPNLILMAPSSQKEAEAMINTAYYNHDHPYVIRYSKNSISKTSLHNDERLEIGSWEYRIHSDAKTVVITYGDHVNEIEERIRSHNLSCDLINARFINPMDEEMLNSIVDKNIIVYETCMVNSSLGSAIVLHYAKHHLNVNISLMGIGEHYVTHGDIENLLKQEKLSMDDVELRIQELNNEKRES